MLILSMLISCLITTTGVSIIEPVDGETYNGDWLTVRAIIENENAVPDSVHYTLNGEPVLQIPRLNTDWPTYMQNQARNGFSECPGPLDASILWTAPNDGFGHVFQSCAVTEGIVYYSIDSLYALDSATGEILWTHQMMGGDDAPIVDNDRLYWASDSVYCFDLSTGEPVWVVGKGYGSSSNPVLYGNLLLHAYKTPSGIPKELGIRCLNADDGSLIWYRELPDINELASCFALWNDLLIVPTYDGPLYAIECETGEIAWENDDAVGGYWDTSPCIVDGVIYIGGCDSNVRAFNASDGELVWSTEISPFSSIEATPAYCEGVIVCGNRKTFFALDASDGGILWQIDKGIHGSPAIAGGHIYWGAIIEPLYPDSIYCANLLTGEIVWSYLPDSLDGGLISTPAIVDGVMYYPVPNGKLYAFGTGLKFTYLDDLYAQIGSNELMVTSFYEGAPVAADTITFTVTGTGIGLDPWSDFGLSVIPNPFQSSVSISFELNEPALTSLQVFDLTGRRITSLVNSELMPGTHDVQWDGCDDSGELVPSGLYLCRIQSGEVTEAKGLCLLR